MDRPNCRRIVISFGSGDVLPHHHLMRHVIASCSIKLALPLFRLYYYSGSELGKVELPPPPFVCSMRPWPSTQVPCNIKKLLSLFQIVGCLIFLTLSLITCLIYFFLQILSNVCYFWRPCIIKEATKEITFCINLWIRWVIKFEVKKIKLTIIWNGRSTSSPTSSSSSTFCLLPAIYPLI